jgi:3-deoxy-manno-octulosonate cytidylyltransferase (CMP-KDO synthetase)
VVNVQGDEPLMPPAMIREAAQLLAADTEADIATLCHALHAREDWLNPNFVKVVMDARGRALYFSRAPIPWKREGSARESPLPPGLAYRHIGLYAYRAAALARFAALPPSALEQCEALEQLRALENGLRIRVGVTRLPPPRGVDTEEDLAAVAAIIEASGIA